MTPCDACGDPTDNPPGEVDEVTSGFTVVLCDQCEAEHVIDFEPSTLCEDVCMVQCQGPCGVLA